MPRAAVGAVLLLLAGASCARHRPPSAGPSLFPVETEWTTRLPDFVEGPLAAEAGRVFVATRDGAVHALDRATGLLLWTVDAGGVPGAGLGVVVVRARDGTVKRLKPGSGATLWTTRTGVGGSLPVVVDREMVIVAGEGLAALDRDSGRVLWSAPPGPIASTVPVPSGTRLLIGETDGTLRCRDRATGVSLWTHALGSAPLAPPLVGDGRRVFVGTTDRRLLSVSLDRGHAGWTWRLGADVQSAPVAFGDSVVFAALDGVLYALKRGNGHLVWRAPLPSRPLAAPLIVGDALLVACAEDEILGFEAKSGRRLGALKTAAEMRTPPLVRDGRVYVGLRDRSVTSLVLGAKPAPPAASPPTGDGPPGQP